jgi:hypothetical protein
MDRIVVDVFLVPVANVLGNDMTVGILDQVFRVSFFIRTPDLAEVMFV